MAASLCSSVSAGRAAPTTRPSRRTVIRSAMASTSLSLWVIKMMDLPCATSPRMILNSSSTSWGVSTAVGSSKIRISALRNSSLMISTRCCTPTGRSWILASGGTARPYCCEIESMRSAAVWRSRTMPARTISSPSMTFSVTVSTGMSMKCWWTMPMPAAIASAGAGELHRLAAQDDLALVGLIQPVQDVHQRALASAVLAQQHVDLARLLGKRHVVVGQHAGEALGDAAKLEDGRHSSRIGQTGRQYTIAAPKAQFWRGRQPA